MSAASARFFELNTVALDNAVFCVNCEMISDSPHDICTVCGSSSLVALCRLLGGTIRKRPSPIEVTQPRHRPTVRYHLELSLDAHDVNARDLNHAIELVTRLSEAGGIVERMHINVESVFEQEEGPALEAA